MTREQVEALVAHGTFPEGQAAEQLIETHISFVILCTTKVYKLKKSVDLGFLDFSTVEKRKHFVEEELRLNQRLCPAMYLRTWPVTQYEGRYRIGGEGNVIDHALEMERIDRALEMDRMLERGLVHTADIDRVLEVLIPFHQGATIIRGKVSAADLYADFADVAGITEFCAATLGPAQATFLTESIAFAQRFLQAHTELITARDREGFIRDVHGDLHAGNIFLTEPPMLFDCIEFDAHYRRIDLLNELAFFTMELDHAGYPELGKHLMHTYNSAFPVMRTAQEEELYLFYKLYRANVRMKINAIRAQQPGTAPEQADRKALFESYFKLYMAYWEGLKGSA